MVWSIDTDDFHGDCDEKLNADRFADFRTEPKVKLNFPKQVSKKFPLLRTLNDAITLSLDEIAQEQNDNAPDKDNEIETNEIATPSPSEPSAAAAVVLNMLAVALSLAAVLKML